MLKVVVGREVGPLRVVAGAVREHEVSQTIVDPARPREEVIDLGFPIGAHEATAVEAPTAGELRSPARTG